MVGIADAEDRLLSRSMIPPPGRKRRTTHAVALTQPHPVLVGVLSETNTAGMSNFKQGNCQLQTGKLPRGETKHGSMFRVEPKNISFQCNVWRFFFRTAFLCGTYYCCTRVLLAYLVSISGVLSILYAGPFLLPSHGPDATATLAVALLAR